VRNEKGQFIKGNIPWMKGRKQSKKIADKLRSYRIGISSGNKGGYKLSDKTKKNMSDSKSGKKPYQMTDVIKNKISKTQIERFKNPENHPRWNGGLLNRKREDKRNDPAYQKWVKEVKKRDKNICRFKNNDCSGYNIVHHILSWRDYPELRYELKNGITLCQYHHPRKRIDEQKFIPIFQEKIKLETLNVQI
jgi:hypothetical protein